MRNYRRMTSGVSYPKEKDATGSPCHIKSVGRAPALSRRVAVNRPPSARSPGPSGRNCSDVTAEGNRSPTTVAVARSTSRRLSLTLTASRVRLHGGGVWHPLNYPPPGEKAKREGASDDRGPCSAISTAASTLCEAEAPVTDRDGDPVAELEEGGNGEDVQEELGDSGPYIGGGERSMQLCNVTAPDELMFFESVVDEINSQGFEIRGVGLSSGHVQNKVNCSFTLLDSRREGYPTESSVELRTKALKQNLECLPSRITAPFCTSGGGKGRKLLCASSNAPAPQAPTVHMLVIRGVGNSKTLITVLRTILLHGFTVDAGFIGLTDSDSGASRIDEAAAQFFASGTSRVSRNAAGREPMESLPWTSTGSIICGQLRLVKAELFMKLLQLAKVSVDDDLTTLTEAIVKSCKVSTCANPAADHAGETDERSSD